MAADEIPSVLLFITKPTLFSGFKTLPTAVAACDKLRRLRRKLVRRQIDRLNDAIALFNQYPQSLPQLALLRILHLKQLFSFVQ